MLTRATVSLLLLLAVPGAAEDRTPQVVGGTGATTGQFPFVVRVDGPTGLCTGSLIRNNWVLTAAHCGGGGAPTGVLIGDAEPGVDGPTHSVATLPVAQWIPHPQYNPTMRKNDIALIRLSADATQFPPLLGNVPQYIPTSIALAASPVTTATSIGSVIVAGFGLLDSGQLPRFVHWAGGLPTFPPSGCDYDPPEGPLTAATQLCWGGYPNACQGDSGGPVFQVGSGAPLQVGVVSFGPEACGTAPSVATYVPGYVPWINQQIDGTTPASPIQYGWELPPSTANGIASGISNFQGWAFSSAGAITSVRLERNGSTVITAPCCSERGDVKNSIPGAPLNTGFAAVVNWGNLGDGTSNFTLVIRDSAGNERRETRSVQTVQILNGVPFAANLGFTNSTQCNLITFDGRAGFECSGLSFQQGTCNGKITFAWLNGKQGVEVVEGCH